MKKSTFDVVIIGSGIMGSATAHCLMDQDDSITVAVIEPDPNYTRASTTLSLGNTRIQFSLRENILVSQYAFDVLEQFEQTMRVGDRSLGIAYRREGNLFLVDEEGKPLAKKAFALQKSVGCRVQWWSTDKIKERYPLFDPEGLVGGTFGPLDGHVDGYAVLMGYKTKAVALGAKYFKDEVTEVVTVGSGVSGVRLASGDFFSAGMVVNCAGAWAAGVARTAGVVIPVKPVKRQVFALEPAVKPENPLPLTVLPSGLYFRTETGGMILLGKSMAEDPVGFDFTWDEKRFMDILWPELAGFVPAFDRLKLVRGWAGLYAVNTLDSNAILGEWPELKGFYLANGFSGHGLQQAPAVGRYLSELILDLPPKLDLSIFGAERILENKPLSESGLV
jgi:glycine/D-amino acid oxidase-like deaminating enzyme